MNLFTFRLPDDSMSGSRLYKGDIIYFIKQRAAENDQVVLVKINEGLLVRRIKFVDGGAIFYPNNPNFQALFLCNNNFFIIGRVINGTFKII